MEIKYYFELQPGGMRRHYNSEAIAKREARRQFNIANKEFGGCCGVYVEIFKVTFEPYSHTKILEYSSDD